MSRKTMRFVVGCLAVAMFALTGLSTVQALVGPEVDPVSPMPGDTMIDPGEICNNIFIACGGLLICPGGCHCEAIGTGSGICINN